jgi:hypothetical protein
MKGEEAKGRPELVNSFVRAYFHYDEGGKIGLEDDKWRAFQI